MKEWTWIKKISSFACWPPPRCTEWHKVMQDNWRVEFICRPRGASSHGVLTSCRVIRHKGNWKLLFHSKSQLRSSTALIKALNLIFSERFSIKGMIVAPKVTDPARGEGLWRGVEGAALAGPCPTGRCTPCLPECAGPSSSLHLTWHLQPHHPAPCHIYGHCNTGCWTPQGPKWDPKGEACARRGWRAGRGLAALRMNAGGWARALS